MHFTDLGNMTQIAMGVHVRAVGWLDAGHPFPTGAVDADVTTKLQAFAEAWGTSVDALGGWPLAGGHSHSTCAVDSFTCEASVGS